MNTTTILLLGILLTSPAAAEFCDGNFVVEAGDWGDVEVHEGGTMEWKRYNWRDDMSYRSNTARMNDRERLGMPEGTPLYTMRIWGVQWVAVYNCKYTYTVVCNGNTFTNDTSSMSYTTAVMRMPCRRASDMNQYIDKVTVTHADGKVRFKIKSHVTDNGGDKHYRTRSKTIPTGIEGVHEWKLPINHTNATLTDATMGCCMLEIETPANVLGFRIDAVSENHSAFFERNYGMMQRNVTENGEAFFEVIGATTENGKGMSSFGGNKYLLPKGDYNLSMILYTPFEKIPVNITMTHETEEPQMDNRRGALRSLISLLTLVGGIYFMLRGF